MVGPLLYHREREKLLGKEKVNGWCATTTKPLSGSDDEGDQVAAGMDGLELKLFTGSPMMR